MSDQAASAAGGSASPLDFWQARQNMLEEKVREIERRFPGLHLYFVVEIGRRRAFLCGTRDVLAIAPRFYRLGGQLGAVFFGETGRRIDESTADSASRILQEWFTITFPNRAV